MLKIIIVLTSILASIQSYASIMYECNFSYNANHKEFQKLQKPFELKIISDDKNNVHYLIGDSGSSQLTKVKNLYGINFLEVTDVGNIMVTTISNSGQSVHSRNSLIFGEFVPSQYYGSCIIK